VNTNDNKSFAWVLLRARWPAPSTRRRTAHDLAPHLHELVLPENVSFPIPLEETIFQQIENLNSWCSFSVFILRSQKEKVEPFYVSLQKGQRPLHICVGALIPPEYPHRPPHYVFIRRFDFLMGKATCFQRFYCEKCLALCKIYEIREHEKKCYGLGQ
jgi:hypothetical protein